MRLMARPTAMDEQFVHQVPELLPDVGPAPRTGGRASSSTSTTRDGTGDVVFFTMAHYPARERCMDSLQMGRVGGVRIIGLHDPAVLTAIRTRPTVPRCRASRWCGPCRRSGSGPIPTCARSGSTSPSRAAPSRTACGAARCGQATSWSGTSATSSSPGTYAGTYSVGGTTHEVDGWIGQRDHSWGVRDHGRCPLWIWFQIQLDDGFLGRVALGVRQRRARVHRRLLGRHRRQRPDPGRSLQARRRAGSVPTASRGTYGEHGDTSPGCAAACAFTLAGRPPDRRSTPRAPSTARTSRSTAAGSTRCRSAPTTGGTGTAIYEVTGARHHRYFPDTTVTTALPA